jgi:hypothetical protein
MRMIFGAIGGMKIGRGNRSTQRKPTPAPLCPPQNPTWQTRSRTPNCSGGKPATNRLSYGAAFFFSPILSPLTTRRVTVEVFDPASTQVQSVSKSWCRAPSGAHDQIFITVWQLQSCFCGVPSLTWGQVCLLYMLLALASAVFLESESLGTRNHISLSPVWDFPLRHLLRLAGSQWRYSTPPPHGATQVQKNSQVI